MKIIDAYWEKRNLGVDCKEITIYNNDNIEDLYRINALFNSVEYLVVKVPIGRLDINNYLTQMGFVFIECSVNVAIKLKDVKLTPLQKRINESIQYSEMVEDDYSFLFDEIKANMFSTDRIFLDPYFSKEQASNRYMNWICDERLQGSQNFKIIYKEDTIGFFSFKEVSTGIYYPFLAGIYTKYLNSGLGSSITIKPIEEAIKRNGNAITTYVSTNNYPVIRSHMQLGFTIQDTHYIFIKHNNSNDEFRKIQ